MGWERDGVTSWYDVGRRRPRHGWTSINDRQKAARARALLAGLPRWMADVEAAVA